MKVLVAFLFIAFSSESMASLFADIHLENGVILSNGDLQQGSKLFAYKREGEGDITPTIFNHNGSNVIRLGTSSSIGTKDRAEIVVANGVQHGQTYYIGFEFYLPYNEPNYPYPTNWFMFTQFRQNGTTSQSPSLSIGLSGSNLVIVGRNDQDSYETLMYRDLYGLFNQWLNLILKVNLDDNGAVTLWFNGEQPETVSYDLKYNCEGCLNTSRLKFGVYRGHEYTPYFVNFDNFRLGQWYSEVKSW